MLLSKLGHKNVLNSFKIILGPCTRHLTTNLDNSDTVDLAYASYESTADADNSSRPPLVILHGLLGSKNNWNSMSKAIHRYYSTIYIVTWSFIHYSIIVSNNYWSV